jgi:hypothetical protein
MRKMVVVADNFYADPDAVRNAALRNSFNSFGHFNYPGWQSNKFLSSEALWDRFEAILQVSLNRSSDRFAVGAFRVINQETGRLVKVHADTIVDWAAMVYLSPSAPADGGTGFFRHKTTGLTGPPTDEQARELGFADRESFERDVIRADMANLDQWELVGSVSPVYNRFVAFRGCEVYHAPLRGWGTTSRDGRMTHSFFFNEARMPDPGSSFTSLLPKRSAVA